MVTFHPALLKFTCAECKKFVYDMETGERVKIWNGHADMERPRGPSGEPEPPCDKCPKISPAHEKNFQLTPANVRTFQLYLEVRATHGAGLTDAMRRDRWLMRNFGLLDGIMRDHERYEQMRFISDMIAGTRTP